MSTEAPATAVSRAGHATPADQNPRVAVLCVHGIGEQKPGSTLRQVGTPFADLLGAVLAKRHGKIVVREATQLGQGGPMSVELCATAGQRSMNLTIYESCWAEAFRPAAFGEMVPWLFRNSWRTALALLGVTRRGVRSSDQWLTGAKGALRGPLKAVAARLPKWIRDVVRFSFINLRAIIQFVFNIARIAVYVAGGIASILIMVAIGIIPVLILTLILGGLWKVTRSTTSSIRVGMVASIGDAYTFECKTFDSAAMIGQVKRDLLSIRETNPNHIMVIAHSLGAAIVYKAFEDSENIDDVDLLVTLGNALAAVKVADRPLTGQAIIKPVATEWRDFYTSFDVVPSGELMFDTNTPKGVEEAKHKSERVANFQSLIRDHSGYFANAEQVMGLLVDRVLKWGQLELEPPFDDRVDPAAKLRRERKNAQSTLSFLFVLSLLATALLFSAAAVQDFGRRSYDLGRGLLGPLPDPMECRLRSYLVDPNGRKLLGSLLLLGVAALLYRLLIVEAWKAWDRSAYRSYVATSRELYSARQMWFPLLVLFGPLLGGAGLLIRNWLGVPETFCSLVGAVAIVVLFLVQCCVLLATHLTLETKDKEPRGWLLKFTKRVDRA